MKKIIICAIILCCQLQVSFAKISCNSAESTFAYLGEEVVLSLPSSYTSYKWYKDGELLSDTSPTFTIDSLLINDVAIYQCISTLNTAKDTTCFQVLVRETFVPNQLIVENSANSDGILLQNGFQKVESCACGIELWEINQATNLENTVAESEKELDEDGTIVGFNILFDLPLPLYCADDAQYSWTGLGESPTAVIRTPKIAIIDSGFNPHISELQANRWEEDYNACCGSENQEPFGYNAVDNCGSIVQYSNHAANVANIVQSTMPKEGSSELIDAKLMNIKTINSGNKGQLFDLICGMHYAIDAGADILNVSLGYYGSESQLLKNVMLKAKGRDILVVTSAGNKGPNLTNHWPSNYSSGTGFSNAISVGAADFNGDIASFSSLADIYAPGENLILKTYYGGKMLSSGTSFSAPFVTSVAAMIWASSNFEAKDVINQIKMDTWSTLNDNHRTLNISLFEQLESTQSTSVDLVVNSAIVGMEVKDALEDITADCTIAPENRGVFRSGETIRLAKGFRAHEGSRFHAYIEDCGRKGYRQAQVIEPINEKVAAGLVVNPNPFSGKTAIHYELEQDGQAQLLIYSSLGQLVQTIVDGSQMKGAYSQTFDAANLPAGIYFVVLNVEGEIQTRKVVLQ